MTTAGFAFSGEPGIWHRTVAHKGEDDVIVPVDLIVPKQIAPTAGRRGTRLPGGHGHTAAHALDQNDARSVVVEVAGPAALVVAKAFKLGERLNSPRRFHPKDAGDVFRLYEANSVDEMMARLRRVAGDERSADVTRRAMEFLHMLFATPRSPGIDLAVTALGGIGDRISVTETMSDDG